MLPFDDAKFSKDFGFFGVFDGHGGTSCSKFVAQRIGEQLATQGCPADAAAFKRLVLPQFQPME